MLYDLLLCGARKAPAELSFPEALPLSDVSRDTLPTLKITTPSRVFIFVLLALCVLPVGKPRVEARG